MKKIFIISIIALLAGMVSCQKEEFVAKEPAKYTLSAVFDETTKVSLAYADSKFTPSWEVGDIMVGKVGENNALFTVISVSAGVATIQTTTEIAAGDLVTLMYIPGLTNASLANIADGKYTVDVSAMKTDVNDLNLIMTASATVSGPSEILTFTNKTSILKLDTISGLTGSSASKISVFGAAVYKTAVVDLTNGSVSGQYYGDLTYSSLALNGDALSAPVYGVLVPTTSNLQVYVNSGNLYLSEVNSKSYIASKCYKMNRTASEVKAFSVSATKKVIIAPGNLQYVSGAFRFAANQKDIIGYSGAGQDLFSWSTDNNSYRYGLGAYPAKTTNGGACFDWGNAVISNWAPLFWNSLSEAEWNYLLNTRPGNRYAYASVDGKNGILIFKDGDTASYGVTVNSRVAWSNYSLTTAQLVESGNIFLPCCGLRTTSSGVSRQEKDGLYWSSDYIGLNSGQTHYVSYVLNFSENTFNVAHQSSCSDGIAVRLVHEL